MICPACGEDPCGVYARCTVSDDELIEVMAARLWWVENPRPEHCWANAVKHAESDQWLATVLDNKRFEARAALSALREAGYEIRKERG